MRFKGVRVDLEKAHKIKKKSNGARAENTQ